MIAYVEEKNEFKKNPIQSSPCNHSEHTPQSCPGKCKERGEGRGGEEEEPRNVKVKEGEKRSEKGVWEGEERMKRNWEEGGRREGER